MSALTDTEAAVVAEYVRQLVAEAPPLSTGQRDRLNLLLRRPLPEKRAA